MAKPQNKPVNGPIGEVLDVHDAAKLLGLSEKTVRRLAAANKLPGRRLGRQWRFLKSELLESLRGRDSSD